MLTIEKAHEVGEVTYIAKCFLAIANLADIGLLARVDPLVDLER